MESLALCPLCKVMYPEEILAPFMGKGTICGICALRVTNRIHGTALAEFVGEHAEEMRQDALDWRTAIDCPPAKGDKT